MKHYRSLIKLKKREVDAFRKQMGNLTQQRSILEHLMENLQNELLNEVETAGEIVELGVFFGDYSEAIKHKQEQVDEQMVAIDKQMEVISGKMMIAYGEQKKFEIALAAKMAEVKRKQDKQEQDFLDELAATRHSAT